MNSVELKRAVLLVLAVLTATAQAAVIRFEDLLAEMADPAAVARWPDREYRSLQASSYNRASTHRDQPGWFADSDGTGFIRTENGKDGTEWVLMEHDGPGCISKMWTPFFYYSFANRTGPSIRIYLDGSDKPVIDEGFIALTRGEGSFKPPFGAATARAGNTFMPIPFARSCRITMTAKPFYFIINYRAYPPDTTLTSYAPTFLQRYARELDATGAALYRNPPSLPSFATFVTLPPGSVHTVELPAGSHAVEQLSIRLPDASANSSTLRALMMTAVFDGATTISAPVGDLFNSADALHPHAMRERSVSADGTLDLRWPMPYASSGQLIWSNRGPNAIRLDVNHRTRPHAWDDRSMHFHALWRPDEWIPGTPFLDWTFAEIKGQGVVVGDVWTVLNPTQGWWGEGDEKIYVDGEWEKGFPGHFGTGTEDYYGWAGGEVPTRSDEFDEPFLANVRVGGVDGNRTRGFNICTRTRALDAIPFRTHMRFDMEASAGTSQRRPSDLLGYSSVTFLYARPGAHRISSPIMPQAGYPIMSLAELEQRASLLRATRSIPGIVEAESIKPVASSAGLSAQPQRPADSMNPAQWSGEAHAFIPSREPGAFVEWLVTEQFQPARIVLHLTRSYDFGIVSVDVNGTRVASGVDLYSEAPTVKPLDLGERDPDQNAFRIRLMLESINPRGRGARTFMGLDGIQLIAEQKKGR